MLSTVCEPVKNGEDIDHIIRDMMFILTNSKTGVGLAANQAGYAKRIIIVKTYSGFETIINPEIVHHSKRTDTKQEGCLSYPKVFKRISRYVGIEISSLQNNNYAYEDFTARIIQHEIDHLNGKCKVGI